MDILFFGAGFGLFGLFFLNRFAGGNLIFQPGGVLNPSLVEGHETLVLVVTLIMIIGFGAKAGMIPLQAWLPTAHPVAPAPASAVLSGIITKAGVLAIIRVIFYQVGTDMLRGTWVQYMLIILALTTVFVGSMLAFKEKLLKKRLCIFFCQPGFICTLWIIPYDTCISRRCTSPGCVPRNR